MQKLLLGTFSISHPLISLATVTLLIRRTFLFGVNLIRVLEIMRQDAQEDPNTFPNATYAKLMLDQVFDISCLLNSAHLLLNIVPDKQYVSECTTTKIFFVTCL